MREPYRVCIVCSGNICRSPMAEIVLRDKLEEAGLAERVVVDSAGTGSWHVGDAADPRALRTLEEAGYDGSAHRAQQFEDDWISSRDLVLVADEGHLTEIRALVGAGEAEHVQLLRSYDAAAVEAGTLEVADPYYGTDSGFDDCLRQVVAACDGVVGFIRDELSAC